MPQPRLLGRRREREALDRLVGGLRAGRGGVLVLRGEAGVGKTALLDHVAARGGACQVVRTAGVEPETEMTYAGLQQLCEPLMGHVARLPGPQRAALLTCFGLSKGTPPNALLAGLATLGLLTHAAAGRPLVCLIDDVQWLDRMSLVILTFVARRLTGEPVALVFAGRDPGVLDGLPELRVGGLPDAAARALLDSVLTGPIDPQVRDRIVLETHGNPLALLELSRDRTPAELAFGFGGQGTASLTGLVEDGFRRRVAALPERTRLLLLTAAVEPIGDVPLLRRALDRLGVGAEAAMEAESGGLLRLGARARFRHPLVRSAVWRSADAETLRAVHRALADATDPHQDPDRRAWHRGYATLAPDEEVAAQLEESAERAVRRGGWSAAATFLERAAELTPAPDPRAARILAAARAHTEAGAPARVPGLLAALKAESLTPRHRAEAERLSAWAAFALDSGRAAGAPLLAAARRLEELDLMAARETYLTALGATVHAGRLGGDDRSRVALAARAVPAGEEAAGLLLTALSTWCLDGYAVAVPHLRRALEAAGDEALGLLWLTVPVAHEIFDDQAWYGLSERAVAVARSTGALSALPTALSFQAGTLLHAGRFAEATGLIEEMEALAEATGLRPDPSGPLNLHALHGREPETLALAATMTADAAERGEARTAAMVDHVRAVLFNGLGRHAEALACARRAAEFPELGFHHWVLGELVEAAAACGDRATATGARDRLAARTGPAGTAWARGVQALADALAGAGGEDRFRAAIALLPRRLTLQRARARLLYGEWLHRAGRPADARTQLRVAHATFRAMGAGGLADRAGRALGSPSARHPG
ncbi:LuxR family transcriptional regulator [Paractinoplanes deccanensis]|uniref:LuxR family transcriptional regulator n=1 Tax=Paractinoplanes deccanensis TaxID=113561 RepID=A0ABQ3Y329_9ACTN|nr:ATP-binding protein [Actinoplanes deccanensis]GID74412.1 LuxR family transcriptional regulator [Actinoplanes deccanensis]